MAAESPLSPGKLRVDPAARFLIATAPTHRVALATRDEGILALTVGPRLSVRMSGHRSLN